MAARSAGLIAPVLPRAAALASLAGLVALVSVWAIATGPIRIPPMEVLRALFGAADADATMVVWTLRAPRVVMALLVGGALGLAGALMQGLFRNPLADPGLLGISAGAAFGAVIVIVLGTALLPAGLRPHGPGLAAFAAALAVCLVSQRLATVEGRTLIATMLLAGVAMNALAGAGTSAFIFASNDLQLRDIMFWTMGSLAGATWPKIGVLLVSLLPLFLAAPLLARGLNALILGEREAGSLGIPLEGLKLATVVVVALGVGASVAVSGTIGFIGLVAPHLVRMAGGADHRWVLPASALLGGGLLAPADALARTVLAPAELPIGLVTALLGAPFFLALLIRSRAATG